MIKEIHGYTGYFIGDDGNVYCNLGKGNRDRKNITEIYKINGRKTKHGYERVYVREDATGKRKDLYIHRLVAEYFIPNPDNKKYVNHKNCIRNDNRVENLEWATAKENTDYTLNQNHICRDTLGRYVSNFRYGGQ